MDINNRYAFILSHLKKRAVLVPLLLLAAATFLTLVYLNIIKNPIQDLTLFQKEPKVQLKTEYKNPFSKETQYVNPFETYKNPFVVAK